MMAPLKSRTGWAFVAVYLAAAAVLYYKALTCSGWLCDFVSLPVVFPLGFPVAWLIDGLHAVFVIPGHTPSVHLRNGYFILPSLLLNSVFYFWLGRLAERYASRLFRRAAQDR